MFLTEGSGRMNLLELIRMDEEDVEKYLRTYKVKTLEDAFRLSFFKWLYIDYRIREGTYTEFVEENIAMSSETCGLCKWDDLMIDENDLDILDSEHWCKFCPVKDDAPICFREFYQWRFGEATAMDVYVRLAREWEWLLQRGEVEPFEL